MISFSKQLLETIEALAPSTHVTVTGLRCIESGLMEIHFGFVAELDKCYGDKGLWTGLTVGDVPRMGEHESSFGNVQTGYPAPRWVETRRRKN